MWCTHQCKQSECFGSSIYIYIYLLLGNLLQLLHSRGVSEQLSACSSSAPSSTANSNSSSPVKNTFPNQSNIAQVKPGPLPSNLDDLKVGDTREEHSDNLLSLTYICNPFYSPFFSFALQGFRAEAAPACSWHACLRHQDCPHRATPALQRLQHRLLALGIL